MTSEQPHDNMDHMASAQATFSGFMALLKWGTILSAIVVAFVITLLAS
jgi:hypothetical protein